jgi:hypothetical protein
MLTQHRDCRIAGNQPLEHEDYKSDTDQSGYHRDKTSDDEPGQGELL